MAASDNSKKSRKKRISVPARNRSKGIKHSDDPSVKKSAQKATNASKPNSKSRSKKDASIVSDIVHPHHFMGRRVITIDWQGEKVQAVEGRFALQHRVPTRLDRSEAEAIFKAEVSHISEPDQFGTSIVQMEASDKLTNRVLKAAESHPDILWCEPMLLSNGSFHPNDDLFPVQWGLKAINAERAWDLWNSNPNTVIIAVLDTGISLEGGRLSHPDLDDPTRFFLGSDWVNNDNDPSDDHGHGTHVMGIIAANMNNGRGIAGLWPGSVLAIKVIDVINRSSPEPFRKGVEQAINFARQRGAHLVINYSGSMGNLQILKTTIEMTRAAGALVVAASGNNGSARVGFPAGYSLVADNVIAVGAIDPSLRRPPFANTGVELTVVAPGVDVMSTTTNYYVTVNNPQLNRPGLQTKYDFMSGTSQATPMVSALAALIWSKFPNLNARQIRDKILTSATRLPGPSVEFGHGLINAEAALT